MTDNDRPAANPSVLLREEFDDWAILFDPDSGVIFSLNPIGVLVWKCLDGKHTIQEILNEMRENCEHVPEEAETHLKDFVSHLVKKGLAAWRSREI